MMMMMMMMMMNVRDMIESKRHQASASLIRSGDLSYCQRSIPHFLQYSAVSGNSYFIHINSRYTGCTNAVIEHSNRHCSDTA
jgi:hypothetical protein